MDAPYITALSAAIVAILGALASLVTTFRQVRVIRRQNEAQNVKLDRIHVLVNSRLEAALTELHEVKLYLARQHPTQES